VNVLVYLLPLALLLGLSGLFAFLWSLKSGQYDDLDGAAVRILSDDDLPDAETSSRTSSRTPSGRSAADAPARGVGS